MKIKAQRWGCRWAIVALLSLAGAVRSALAQQPTLSDLGAVAPAAPRAFQQARTLMLAGRFADAEHILRDYLHKDERSGEAHELLGDALLREDKPQDALGEYTQAAALEQPSSHMLQQVSKAYVLLNDNQDADKWGLHAVEMDPKDADAWYNLGRVRYTEQRFSDAASCFQHVLQLAPKAVKAENNLGLSYEGMNRMADAEAAYRQAIVWQDAGPASEKSEQPLLNLGIVLLHQGQLAEAESLLETAVKLAPADPQVREQLGHVYLQQSKFAAAQVELARACELDPGKSGLHFLLGQTYKHLGQTKQAEAEFAISAKLAQNDASPPSR